MSKKDLSEADICAKFITPAVLASGWQEQTQIAREVHFTKGQIHVRGKMVTRGKSKFADYVLYYKPNIPIAIIEAKDNNHSIGDGMQQALGYCRHPQHPVRLLVERRRLRLSRSDWDQPRAGVNPGAQCLPEPRTTLAKVPAVEGFVSRG
jgi:2-methylcitrate dehydratase PrpD